MVFKIIQENKLIGFTYYPLLENILGVFFLFMAFFVPLLFYRYNGFKTQQWDEWLFLVIFFIIFLLLGKNLGYQNMKVELKNDILRLRQDMRFPEVNLTININEWLGIKTDKKEIKGEFLYSIDIINKSEYQNFYQTKNLKEFNQINELLTSIFNENKKENLNITDKGEGNESK